VLPRRERRASQVARERMTEASPTQAAANKNDSGFTQYYAVKWTGFGYDKATLEPEQSLTESAEGKVTEFWRHENKRNSAEKTRRAARFAQFMDDEHDGGAAAGHVAPARAGDEMVHASILDANGRTHEKCEPAQKLYDCPHCRAKGTTVCADTAHILACPSEAVMEARLKASCAKIAAEYDETTLRPWFSEHHPPARRGYHVMSRALGDRGFFPRPANQEEQMVAGTPREILKKHRLKRAVLLNKMAVYRRYRRERRKVERELRSQQQSRMVSELTAEARVRRPAPRPSGTMERESDAMLQWLTRRPPSTDPEVYDLT